jgi:hypothetical protein
MTHRFLVVLLMILGVAASASAQGPYVAGSFVGDIVRSSYTNTGGPFDATQHGGEAFGWAVRAGTPIGARWGVEAEFARPSEFRSETGEVVTTMLPFVPPFGQLSFSYQASTRERNTTLSTSVWVQQTLSSRVALVYHGGVSFIRTERMLDLTSLSSNAAIFSLPAFQGESVAYGVRPFVGVESPLVLHGPLYLVPGIRLHGLEGGWLIRPSVGIGWNF